MKKTLSLILALLMSASCAATIFADEDVEAISAITEDAPAAEEEVVEAETEYDLAIEFLEAKKILQGKGDGLLHAEDAVKRYEMAILGARVATGWVTNDQWMNGTADNTKFNDLEGSGAKDALGALSYANQNGIVVGYPDGSFKPENTVTYRDALAIAVRTLGYTGLEYPWGIIEKAVTLGLTDDITGVAYTDEINRGVAAQIIYNALFAKTAGNKTLAMESFGCEYGWETIVVVADEKVVYEVDAKYNDTKDATGIVAFKLVNNDGTFGSEVFNVKADLAFGGFYNALFEIDADAELVDLVKAIEIAPETISNRGNDLETADAIGAFLADYSLVEKYNVKNLSKTTLYDDELILKGEEENSVIINWDAAAEYTVAFDWESGDIVELDKDGKFVKTLWKYNAEFEYYFQYKEVDSTAAVTSPEYFGIDIMDEDDVAKLRAYIKDAKANHKKGNEYNIIDKYSTTPLYADLTVWNLNGDDLADYAIYEEYKFGKYEGLGEKDCCCDNSTAHKVKFYKLGDNHGDSYIVEGTCAHHDVKGGHYTETYTWAEGFEPSEGYTGYVIYGVDKVKNELKIVKEIADLGKNTDEDSYVSYGLVRAFNLGGKTVTIGDNDPISWDISGLVGVDAANEDYYGSLFNQFVKYVLVDGKLAHIELSGNTDTNYIVVEKYLGVDNDGYIVIQGYTTDTCKLGEFRIGAYDGWKQGDYFFYGDEAEIAADFVKGAIYKITSTDNTEANGNVYYVTSLGDMRDEATDITFTFEDNYRISGDTATKMNAADVYVIIGNKNSSYNFKPVYLYKGIVPDYDDESTTANEGWSITGKLVKSWDNGDGYTYIIVDADYTGFNADSYKVGFVALASGNKYPVYDKVGYDRYVDDYYYYGATEYAVKGFDLINVGETTVTGYNLDLDADKIYATIDGVIVDTADAANDIYDMDWFDFWRAAKLAYNDDEAATADYYFFTYDFDKDTDAAEISKEVISGYIGLKNKHGDVVAELIKKEIVLDANNNLTKVDDVKIDWTKAETVKAYCIYRAADAKVVVYLNEADFAAPFVPETEVKSDVLLGINATEKVYIDATADLGTTATGDYTIEGVTFEIVGADLALMSHATIDEKNYYFGETGACTTESWNLTVETSKLFDAKLVAGVYNDKHEVGVDCDLVKKVAVSFAPVTLTTDWTVLDISFEGHELVDGVKKDYYDFLFNVSAKLDANGDVVFGFVEDTDEQDVGCDITFVKRANAKLN